MFFAIYKSPWHHPGVCWVAGLLLLGLAGLYRLGLLPGASGRRLRIDSRLWLFVLLELLILLDASLTGALSPLDPKGAAARNFVIAFVLLGDARYYYLLFSDEDSLHAAGTERWKKALRAVCLALISCAILPLSASLLQRRFPTLLPTLRHLFLLDELLLLTAATAISFRLFRRKQSARRTFRLQLSLFVVAQYALWVLADVLILGGGRLVEPGFALRLLPNTLYYAAFLPFAVWAAERCARAQAELPLAEAT